ncbi:hypothetical protein MHZ36_02680 [Staphylococcus sp. ACRSN]|uniref:hypothetical protein n=1 Tax=Staphylococcus sp. ACRSN TaxID=2918214 RepID=UPI001EF38B3B|nr:hypothetical protein [Staphylococcus sp. ACRSN]MCG7338186.1 hypothetical protein [Staphylococcus sp. ACRSN]
MTEKKRQFEDFEHTLTSEPMHRGSHYGRKKKSWINIVIQVIVFILVAITGYSMFKEPILNLTFVNEPITFHQITNLQDTVNQMGNLNINIENIDNLQTHIDSLILVFYVFFIACILSLILTCFTLIFNRTALKIVNLFILAVMFVITFGFSFLIENIAKSISDSMSQHYISLSPEQILTEADAIHNAFILLTCSLALLLISLFFRNRKAKI